MTDIRVFDGNYEANKIAESLLIAFWKDETIEDPGYHLKNVHNSFLELARKLGYRVERITEEETV